jgi:hypothetical protein
VMHLVNCLPKMSNLMILAIVNTIVSHSMLIATA